MLEIRFPCTSAMGENKDLVIYNSCKAFFVLGGLIANAFANTLVFPVGFQLPDGFLFVLDIDYVVA